MVFEFLVVACGILALWPGVEPRFHILVSGVFIIGTVPKLQFLHWLLYACMLNRFSCVWLFETLWIAAHQVPVHRILQATILEWIATPSFKGSSQSRDLTCVSYVSCIGRQLLYHSHHLEARLPYKKTQFIQFYLCKKKSLCSWDNNSSKISQHFT